MPDPDIAKLREIESHAAPLPWGHADGGYVMSASISERGYEQGPMARCAFCNGSGKGNWLSTAILAEDARRQAEPNVLRATLAAVREKVKELDFGHDTECRANIWPDRGTCDCDHDDNAAVVSALSKVLEQTP